MTSDKETAALDPCPACARDTRAGRAFCTSCGAPLAQRLERRAHNPFERIKMRSLVIWAGVNAVVAMALFGAVFEILGLDTDDEGWVLPLVMVWAYAALAAWLAWQLWRRRVRFSRLIGSLPEGYDWLPTVGVLAAAFVFSVGSAILIPALLSYAWPEWVEGLMAASDPLEEPVVFLLATALVVAPVIEEILFRGVILHRLAVKWGLGPAIVVSSAVFGLLHVNFVGIGVLGVVMSLLYLRTRTLILPITCHVLHNAVAVSIVILGTLTAGSGEEQTGLTSEQARDGVIVGSALLLLSAPVLAHFVYKSWPRAGARPPYLAQAP